MKSIISLFFVCVFILNPAFAQSDNKGFCEQAQSTADLVACIGDHYNSEIKRMGDEFEIVLENHSDDPEFINAIESNQQTWITTRNQSCANEANIYQGGSLERVQELNCLARLTSNRVNHLKNLVVEGDHDEVIREYSAIPRWVNVLRSDYSDIFWRFAGTQDMDIDCDGVNEKIVQGLRPNDNGYESLLAIADSRITGRPTAHLLSFNADNECRVKNNYNFITLPAPKPVDGQVQCTHHVEIQTENCGDYLMKRGDEGYTLESKISKKDKND